MCLVDFDSNLKYYEHMVDQDAANMQSTKYKYTVSTYAYNSWPSFTCTIPGCYLEIIKYNLEQVGSRQKCRLWSFGSHKFGSSWCIMTFNLNFSLKCYFAQDFARQLNKPRLLVLWSPLSWLKRCFFSVALFPVSFLHFLSWWSISTWNYKSV